ncbi:hypothetical protein GCM10011342_05810 [Aquisalinus flavus]|uniref:Uncharacterized protein n=1 Tax=Aquisalinus flavus TaxID=1526572 RepID=A0A8J2Y365_9PROT|nr:hypothetical protein GCM10011342_05810 [Aquisalinus flavus]
MRLAARSERVIESFMQKYLWEKYLWDQRWFLRSARTRTRFGCGFGRVVMKTNAAAAARAKAAKTIIRYSIKRRGSGPLIQDIRVCATLSKPRT